MAPDAATSARLFDCHRRLVEAYFLALAATLVAVLVSSALAVLCGARYPFASFYVAVAISAGAGGLGPGLVSTLLGALAAPNLWEAPGWIERVDPSQARVELLVFIACGVTISALHEGLRRRVARHRDARLYAEAAQAAADEALRAQSHRAAVVAHELRDPLGIISLHTALIALKAPSGADGEALRGAAARVECAVVQMARLIRDLLDTASIEAGRLAVEPRVASHRVAVQRAVELVESRSAARHVAVEHSSAGDVEVCWDHDRVGQLLANLLGNAVELTPEGGQVRIETFIGPESVRISVVDAGPGIAADALPHVFERFWTGRGRSRGGTGLGLFIAQGIAAAHGGAISVASELGAGTTFEVVLPYTMPGPPAR